jgi:hypothetical protein
MIMYTMSDFILQIKTRWTTKSRFYYAKGNMCDDPNGQITNDVRAVVIARYGCAGHEQLLNPRPI